MTAHSPLARYDSVLLDYAAGNLPRGPAFVVAAHLALVPQARRDADILAMAGGVLLDEMDPVAIAPPAWLTAGDAPAPAREEADSREAPVARVLESLDRGRWRRSLSGGLIKPVPGTEAQLIKFEAGRRAPAHGHGGVELTLVLSGRFEDEHGRYGRGDLVIHDEDSEHAPGAAFDGDCICLIAETAPVRLKGPLGWLADRFRA